MPVVQGHLGGGGEGAEEGGSNPGGGGDLRIFTRMSVLKVWKRTHFEGLAWKQTHNEGVSSEFIPIYNDYFDLRGSSHLFWGI